MKADAVIAVRGGPDAKSRLAQRLNASRRDALIEAMLVDMLTGLANCASVRRILVTTPTKSLAGIAAMHRAQVIDEPSGGSLNGAFEGARQRIAADGPEAFVLLLPGDLPRLDPAEIDALIAAAGPDRLALAPAAADGGTGALAFQAGLNLPLAFGPGSFDRHLAAARGLGLDVAVKRSEGLGFDIDSPTDLDALIALDDPSVTGGLLRGWRVAA